MDSEAAASEPVSEGSGSRRKATPAPPTTAVEVTKVATRAPTSGEHERSRKANLSPSNAAPEEQSLIGSAVETTASMSEDREVTYTGILAPPTEYAKYTARATSEERKLNRETKVTRKAAERREGETEIEHSKRMRRNELDRKRWAEKKAESQGQESRHAHSHEELMPVRQAADRREGETEEQHKKRLKRNEMARKKRAEEKTGNRRGEIAQEHATITTGGPTSESMSEDREVTYTGILAPPTNDAIHPARTKSDDLERNRNTNLLTSTILQAAKRREGETEREYNTRMRRNEAARKKRAGKKADAVAANGSNALLVEVVHGDITHQGIEIVVNTAHEKLIPGRGIDGAIRSAEGSAFNALTADVFAEYRARKKRSTLDYGDSLVIPATVIGGAKNVVHVVGPRLAYGASPSAADRNNLIKSYQAAFQAAENSGCQEVVVPFISAGIFRYPMDQSQQIALHTVLQRMPKLKRVVFCHTDAPVVAAFAHLMGGKKTLQIDSQAHANALAAHLLHNASTGAVNSVNSNGDTSMEMDIGSENGTSSKSIHRVRKANGGFFIRRNDLAAKNEKARNRTDEERSTFNATRNARRRHKAETLNKTASNILAEELKDYSKIENSAPKQLHLGELLKCEDCGALTYTHNCCQNGSVCIPPPVDQPKKIKDLLTGSDPESIHFREASEFRGADHPGTLERPRKELESFLYKELDDGGPPKYGVWVVQKKSGSKLACLGYFNPVVDAVCYPLIFPYGQAGYKYGEFKRNDPNLHAIPTPSRNQQEETDDEEDDFGCEEEETTEPENQRSLFADTDDEEGGEMDDLQDGMQGIEVSAPDEGESMDTEDLERREAVDDEAAGQCGAPKGNPRPCGGVPAGGDNGDDDVAGEGGEPTGNPRTCDGVSAPDRSEAMDWKNNSERREAGRGEAAGQCGAPKGNPRPCGGVSANEEVAGEGGEPIGNPRTCDGVSADNDDDDELRDEDILETELQSRERDGIAGTGVESQDEPPDCDVNLLRHPGQEEQIAEEDEDIELEQSDVNFTPTGKNRKRQFVSRREFLLHQMQMRDPQFHPVLSTLLLGQLYVIDQALRVIRQRNDNMRRHCIELRGATAQSLNFLNQSRRAQQKGYNLGYVFRVSRKAAGSAGWYKERFENAMAVIDKMGKPDLFITMTGDPNWPEIKDNLLPNTNWQSNPFLVNDVFYKKMQELIHDVVEKELFGPVVAFCYSVEFQKRGMPHMHMLLTLAEGSKLETPADIDKHIWARIPPKPEVGEDNYEEKLRFHNNVVDKMVHTPCEGRPDSYCNERPSNARKRVFTKCTKCFPMDFAEFTSLMDGGKVKHKRPNDGVTCMKKAGNLNLIADNRPPYSPFLLNKYGCHINVEAVTRVNVVKYIYKYIYKGFDKALVQIVENFEVDNGTPSGQLGKTTVHASQSGATGVMAPTGIKGTMKQWRDYNIKPADGEKLIAFDEAIMMEVFRQMTASKAAWIAQAYPLAGLSHTVKNLSVHDEGEQNIFFKKGEEERAAGKAGEMRSMLLAWFELNREDPSAREFTFDEIPLHYKFEKNPKNKWTKYIRKPTRIVVRVRPVSPRFLNKFAIRLLALHQKGPQSFEELRTAVEEGGNGREGNCFFLHGSGGCGKTYVYKALYYYLEHIDVSVTMVATTGIASTLLIKGTTAHRMFMLPLNLVSDGRSTMRLETTAAEELRRTRVIVFDEATMANKNVYSAIDHLLRDIMEVNTPFGGKIMLLGGDWKQLLPVVPGASSDEAVQQTLKADPMWSDFQVLHLKQNMRAKEDAEYSMLLENIGNGMQNGQPSTTVDLDPECLCKHEDEVIEFIYGGKVDKVAEISSSCILTTLNAETTEINEKVGAIVILLRNLNVLRGLCNGTRMEVIEMREHIIVCKLISTKHAGKIVWIAKAKMTPADGNPKKAKYERFQFPLRLAYAMTINKAQGQTFDKVGIVLRNNVFSHGQLYVALSRARKSRNVRLYSSATALTKEGKKKITVYNKVERSVLEDVDTNTLRSSSYVTPEPVEPLIKFATPRRTKRAYNAVDFSTPSIQPRRKARTTSADVTSRREESTIERMEVDEAPSLIPIDHGPHLLLANVQLSCFLNALVQCLRVVSPLNAAIMEGIGRGEECKETVCGALRRLLMASGVSDAHDLREAIARNLPLRDARILMKQEYCINELLRRLFGQIPATATGLFTFVETTRVICYSACTDRPAAHESCALIPLVVQEESISLRALLDTQRAALLGGCANCSQFFEREERSGEKTLHYDDVGAPFVILMLSITDEDENKIDYRLQEGEDLEAVPFAGSMWTAIAMAEHHGRNKPGQRGGHYTAWTRNEETGEWWSHDDSKTPVNIGTGFRKIDGAIDMRGITTIVCKRAN